MSDESFYNPITNNNAQKDAGAYSFYIPNQDNSGTNKNTTNNLPALNNNYQPPQIGVSPTFEYKLMDTGSVYTGSIDYGDTGDNYKRTTTRASRHRNLELKNIDAKLARGHMIYLFSIFAILIAVVVSFSLSLETVVPYSLEIYRIALVGFIIYILTSAITALKRKLLSTQVLVVYFLKWYILLFVVYCILKFVFLQNTTAMILIDIGELAVISILLAAAIRVRNELKKRDELLTEMSFESFFTQ